MSTGAADGAAKGKRRRCFCLLSPTCPHPADGPDRDSAEPVVHDGLCELYPVTGAEAGSTPGSPTESWVLTGSSPAPGQSASGVPRSSQGAGSTSGATDVAFRFDDADVVHLSDEDLDLDLDTDEAPFDYEVPFDQPLLHEVYEFEARYPRAAPIIRALLRLPGARRAQRAGRAIASQAQALQHGSAAGAEHVAQAARFIIGETGRLGEAAADEASRWGQDMAQTVRQRCPGIARAMGAGWLGTLAHAV